VLTIFHKNGDNLFSAFDLPRGITALVGGGGKTTLLLRLARELAQSGARVIVSTTTHIFPPEGMPTSNPQDEKEAGAALERDSLVCFGKRAEQGKLTAPDLAIANMVNLADYVLIEADGAKHLPLKAPAEHEPVIPPKTSLVLAVAGLDGAGKQICEVAFRPALYASLCGKTEEDEATALDIARVLTHPNGQRKGVPEGARFAVLLNKADDEARLNVALAVATELKQYPVERVVIAALNLQSQRLTHMRE